MKFGVRRGVARNLLTASLIAALPLMLQPVVAQPLVHVTGTVFANGQGAPLEGARVHLMQYGTKAAFTSSVTSADGMFEVGGLPVASYEAAVEFDGGLYVVEAPVVVAEGRQDNLNLSLPQLAQDPTQRKNVRGSGGFLNNPLTATLLVVGSAFLVGVLIDSQISDDDDSSPF